MTGALSPGGRSPGTHDGGPKPSPNLPDPLDLWSRDFGQDQVSELLTLDRAVRARDVSRPGLEDEQVADDVIDELLARIDGRRAPARS